MLRRAARRFVLAVCWALARAWVSARLACLRSSRVSFWTLALALPAAFIAALRSSLVSSSARRNCTRAASVNALRLAAFLPRQPTSENSTAPAAAPPAPPRAALRASSFTGRSLL